MQLGRNKLERGALYPLLLVIVVALLIFAGLALDSTIVFVSKSEQQQLAQSVALTALRTYINTPGDLDARLNSVRDRTQEIIRGNIRLSTRFQADPNAGDNVDALGGGRFGGSDGLLIPGIWHFAEPADCTLFTTTCPCSDTLPWRGPCFQQVNIDANPEINAFRAELVHHGNSAIRTLFMRVANVESVSMRSMATATTFPRHAVFLLDLSRKAHEETHQPYESGTRDPVTMSISAESAFALTGSCADYPSCPPGPIAGDPPPGCDIKGGIVPQINRYIWYGTGAFRPIRFATPAQLAGARANTRQHFKQDYRCFDLTWSDPLIRPLPFSESYLVDTRFDPPRNYLGPEPLSSMMAGVNRGINTILANTVAGDRIGFIGYDFSASVTERTIGLLPPNAAELIQLENLTDPANPPCLSNPGLSARECAASIRMLFPRKEGGSNLPEAVRRAREMLRLAPPNEGAEELVVAMSSGLPNCSGNRVCGNSQAAVEASLAEVEQILTTRYVDENIRFHMMQLSEATGPHTLLAPSPGRLNADGTSAGCMTDEEVRRVSPELVNTDVTSGVQPQDYLNALTKADAALQPGFRLSQPHRFFLPNRIYSAVAATGGIWAPIRRACQSGVDVTPELENACRGQTFTRDGSRPGTINLPPYTDNFGRLLCEPTGVSTQQQIFNAVDRIFSRSPYIIVE